FPELVVSGYPPRDLLFRVRFVGDVEQTTREIAAEIGEVPALVGYTEANRSGRGRTAFNSAAVCHRGQIVASARKCLLPTYDVFDEDRYFEPATDPVVVVLNGKRVGVTICEDIWAHESIPTRRYYDIDPVQKLAGQKLDLLVNLSASAWHSTKESTRRTLVSDAARACKCPAVYVNAIGGNDELIFDGRSMACDADGKLVAGL